MTLVPPLYRRLSASLTVIVMLLSLFLLLFLFSYECVSHASGKNITVIYLDDDATVLQCRLDAVVINFSIVVVVATVIPIYSLMRY